MTAPALRPAVVDRWLRAEQIAAERMRALGFTGTPRLFLYSMTVRIHSEICASEAAKEEGE